VNGGLQTVDNFLEQRECDSILNSIQTYRAKHEVPLIYRQERKRSLRYSVINGEEISGRLPQIQALYHCMLNVVRTGISQDLVPLPDRKVCVNVNITPQGGEYRWHYDRNAVTVILYLNEVEGGEIEAYPNYRFLLTGSRTSRIQSYVDGLLRLDFVLRLFGNKLTIPPKPGLLVIMRGDRCLHSVRPVTGSDERICIVMSFDSAHATFPQEKALDSYLYSASATRQEHDPNYSS
jgi:2OG-Fe(II) oxygenase superfamily